MKWTWQLKNFPNFIYDQNVILAEEQQYLKNVGRISAIVNVIEENEMLGLKIDLLTQEAITN